MTGAASGGPDTAALLKHATAAAHAAIEARLALDRPIDRARYGRVLQGFAAFLAAWEACVGAALPPSHQAFFEPRRRLALALTDLHALGLPAPPPAPEVRTIDLASLANVYGALYVLEGSTLGGQVLCRLLAAPLGLTPSHGLCYFHGHGSETGAMWNAFKAALRHATPDDGAAAQAVASAAQTFAALDATFARTLGATA